MTPTPRAWLMTYPGDDPSTDWCTVGPTEPQPDDDGTTIALFDQAAIDSAVAAERERCAKMLREMWYEREATHGNRAGPYHDGWTAALDLAERRLTLGDAKL